MDDSPEDHRADCEFLLNDCKNRVEYNWNGKNIGLCKSVNSGIDRAKKLGAKWVLIMNPDSKPHNDIVSIFRRFLDQHNTDKVAILAPQYNYDRHQRSAKRGNRRIKHPDMSGSLINVKTLDVIGDYDERYYIDGLDVELCLRATRAGYEIIECSEAVLDHHPAETKELGAFGHTVIKYGRDKPERYYYGFRSSFLIHNEYKSLSIYNDIFSIYKFLKAITFFEKSDYIKVWKEAKEDYKRGFFGKYEDQNGDGH